jgi:tetratricopeptide (TPR) repeat protein/TolB-like protein
MSPPSAWTRIRQARLVRVVAVYAAASWAVLQVTDLLGERLQLPPWLVPVAFALLLVGFVMITATAWVQAHPAVEARAAREEVPGAWEIDLGDVGRSVARGRLPHLTWGRSLLGGVVAFSLLFGLAGLYVVVKDRGRTFGPGEAVAGAAAPGVAILPFGVSDPSLDRWREGMVDLLSTNLDGIGGVRAIDSRTVLAGWRGRAGGADSPGAADAIEVARGTGARWAVVGNAVSNGDDLRLAATVYDAKTGARLGQHRVEGSPDSLFALVDRLSIDVLGTILPQAADDALPQVSLARAATTASLPALRAFLEGEALFRRSRWKEAIGAYERAVQEDTSFALAYFRLSTAYGWSESIGSARTQAYEEKGARLVHRLPEREALLARGSTHLIRADVEGLEVARQAAARYPDDPEAWLLLGEFVWHLGDAVLEAREESERAFRQAVRLDPTFAPGYIHLIDNAFSLYADSARAAELAATYLGLAAGAEGGVTVQSLPVMLDLAFGDSIHRAAAAAALDSLPTRAVFGSVVARSWHPRLLDFQARLLDEFATRSDAGSPENGPIFRAINAGSRGRLADVDRALEDPLVPPGFVVEQLLYERTIGLRVAEERLEAALRDAPALDQLESREDEFTWSLAFYRGAWAAEHGRAAEQRAAVERLRTASKESLVEGDSALGRLLEGMADGVVAFAEWKRGRAEAALPALLDAQRRATGHAEEGQPNVFLRWWIAELLLELDRPREAERYLESLTWYEPMARLRLARLYEELEEFEKAREEYELFAAAWADPDPELRPLRDEARAAARRLTSAIRE